MIKQSIFENDLITGMIKELHSHDKKQGMENLVKAVDYLHSAMDILEENGLASNADKILNILVKIAKSSTDASISELTSDKMVENLKHHGIVFNIKNDSSKADDLLNLDINDADLEVNEKSEDKPFEDKPFEDCD